MECVACQEEGTTRITNSAAALQEGRATARLDPEVVLLATCGWYWAVDAAQAARRMAHLAHPLGVRASPTQGVTQDHTDAAPLANQLPMDRLPEVWIAPPATRELRERVRYRARLVGLRAGLKAQVLAVMGELGIPVSMSELFGVGGPQLPDATQLPAAYDHRVRALRGLIDAIDAIDTEVGELEAQITTRLRRDRGHRVIQQVLGVGPVLATVFVAESGDVHRFPGPRRSAPGPASPRAIARPTAPGIGVTSPSRARGWRAGRRGGSRSASAVIPAQVALPRRLLVMVDYGLCDGEIRAVARPPAVAA